MADDEAVFLYSKRCLFRNLRLQCRRTTNALVTQRCSYAKPLSVHCSLSVRKRRQLSGRGRHVAVAAKSALSIQTRPKFV